MQCFETETTQEEQGLLNIRTGETSSPLPDLVCNSLGEQSPVTSHTEDVNAGYAAAYVLYARRWYVLVMFSAFCFTQNLTSSMWSAIESVAQDAYGWTEADIALINNWPSIISTLALLPCAWIVHRKGELLRIIYSRINN